MCEFTFRRINLFKLISFLVFFLFVNFDASAQFFTKHYIAPAPWQYFSKANEIVIATNSTSTVNIVLSKSDGTLVANLTAVKGAPAVYRFAGLPSAAPALAFNTVLNAAGLIITGSSPISINLRNVASDALGGDGTDKDIKGNAALTSFGDAGIGIKYRIGYYRDGSLGNFNSYGDQRPIYTIMAISNGTSIKLNGTVIATLNAGQSYLFKAAIGSLVESSNPTVMNTSAAIDTPNGCGDGAFNQIPPESVLGSEYFIERGKGNDTAEQTTVVATKPNTKVTVNAFSATGALVSTSTTTLATAGSFFTFLNGVSNTNFSASRVSADNNVAVYSGTAQSCEVDISTIAPVSDCGGSNFIETAKFRNYGTGSLPYFGYILLKDASSVVLVNGTNIETVSGVAARHQLGTTGWYLINFEDNQIGSPNILSISSTAKLTVSIVQQGGGFSMAGFFSNFAAQPEDPTLNYVSGGGCTNSSAALTTPSGFAPYQWYYNGTAISGATADTYVASKTGSYSVSSTLSCGSVSQSKPVSVTLCTDLGVTKTVDVASPCVNSNVQFTITVSNLGLNNATGVSINDLLPSGYTFVSSVPSTGTYNSATGVWSIGDLDPSAVVTLKVTAIVNATGSYNNTAALPASMTDSNSANNSASIATTPKALPVALSLSGSTICIPASGGSITSTTSVSGVNYQLYNSSNVAVQAVKAGTGSGLTWSGISAGTGYYVIATNSGSCTINSNAVAVVSDTQKPTITCPANVAKTTDANSCTATGVALGTPTTADNCGVASVTNNAPASYPIGLTTVTWTVTDNSGNTQTCTQTVTITDTQKPTITCPANVAKTTDANSCTATGVALGTPTTSDNCGVASVANNAPASYPIGLTTVTWTVTDNSGNTQTCTQTVTITDTQKPTITCPANVAKTTDANSCTATGVALGTPTTSDNCGVASVTNNAPASYPIGLTTVTWTVTDNSGNTQTCTQTVTITDTQKPTITCPANVAKTTDANSCTATGVALGTPTTADNCGVASVTNNTPASYPIGLTTVTWTVTDNSGNTQTCTQTVTITDTQKPTITCPANVAKTTDANSCTATGVALGTPTTSDNCGVASVTNNAPASYPIGLTTVTWTVTDNSGNTQTCTQTVTITDTQKPTITCPANVAKTTDANSCTATGVALGTPTTSDNCGVASVTNNAPASYPIGLTTVTWTVTDNSGNTQTCTQTVTITDTQKPTITCPANVAKTTDANSCTATGVTLGTPTTSDNCGVASVTNNAPASYPIGLTTVTWTVTDNSGNTQTCTQNVKIVGPILAKDNTVTSFNGYVGGTAVSNVLDNDLLNCSAVIGNDVTITLASTLPNVLSFNTITGLVGVNQNTPAGTYTFDYTICEKLNPTNCSTATVSISVSAPTIDAVIETTTSINGNTGGTTTALTANDTLNGTPVVIGTNPGEIKLTGITVPTGLTLNANGRVTVAANTPAGNYNVEYSICEITNPTNCDTVISVVAVSAPTIDAVTENTATINGNTGGTTTSLTANDTLNGAPVVIGTNPGEIKLTGITVPTGLTLNANGTVSVAANTPAGNYNVEYSICEITNPTNCDTVISVVVVGTATIDAVTETTATINGNTGGTTTALTANDTLNGAAVVIGTNPGEVKLTGITVPTGLILNANGTVTVAANTPAGNYNVEYSICEITNATNCDAVISVVTVGTAAIDAVTETTTSINGNTGGTTTALTANDTLNAAPVIIGTNPGEVKLTVITVPTGLTLNANGTVTVAPNTPAGNYNVEYSICEITNPTNCDTVISVVTVSAGTLVANADTSPPVVTGNTSQTLVNVFDNDTKNGIALVPADVNLTITIADPTGYLTVDTNGNAILGANTPAGNYELTYTICEKLNPSNCSSNTVKVTVGTATIDAVTETTTSINGNTGGTTTSLTANDTLNAAPVVIGTNPGEVKLTGITVPTGLILNTNGTVTVAANTPAGNYNVEYSICEITNPTNCDTVISEVTVSVGTLVANADTPPSVVAGNTPQTLVNVFNNDTKNGVALVPADVNLTTTIADPTGYLTLDTNGNAILGANTPAGNYELTYTICEKLNPSNCSSNTVKVTVGSPVIDAVTETTTSINGNTGGTTTSLTTNDTLNGAAVVIGTNSGEVKLTGITVPTGLILNANGTVTVAANTPAGNYNVEYSICEITNPTNCDTVISVVVVGTATIDAVTETTTSINGNTGGTTTSLTANDTLNAAPVVIGTNPGEVKLTGITVPTGLILNTNGTVTVAANTPAGNYNVEYSICEITNPTNCDTVISEVTVSVGTLIANADTPPSVVAGNTPQTLVNVFDNDTKNGVALVPADVNLTTTIADPTGYLTLDTNGNAILGANTPAGNYELTYTICEKLNPSNCSSNTVKVTVGSPVIDAVTETTTSINGNTGGTTTSLTTNDTLNGAAVVIGTNSGEVKLTGITVPTGLILNANGTVTVAANTPAGNYNVEYSICEITNPTNCDTVISVVTVGTATIDAVTETTTSINGNTGGTTTSLTANDTLNAAPVVIGTNPGEVKLTGITVPTGLILNTNGTVTVAPNTPAGNYNVEYSICEITNPTNCDTVISVVTVSAGTLVANADTSPPVVTGNTSQTLVNVFDNDTKNGIALVPADVNLTITIADPTGYLTVDTNGNAILGANTPAGNYELTYTICEKLNPSNCSSNTVKVTVGTATIDAVTETTTSINGNTGGTTTSLTTNDTLNGAAVVIGTNSGEVKLTGITVPTGLILNANGTVTVAANTPAGNYNVEYSICEITNPTNCDTVISVVVVGTATIDAVTETTTSINGNTGGTTTSLTANDTLNAAPVVIGTNPGEVKLTGITVPTGLILNTNGTVTVAANTPAGNYNVEYSICEITNPTNCDTVISEVTVSVGTLIANADTPPSVVAGNTPQTLVNVFDNDTKNGVALVPADVNLTITIADPIGYLTLDTNGNAILGANAPAGNYELTYTICEKLNPSNCSSNTVKVTVGKATIDAVRETTTSINGNTGGTTTPLTANDTLNGAAVVIGTNSGEVKLTGITVPTGLILNANGTVSVAANTPAGNYNVEYSICEITNPTNCDTVISVVTVGTAAIDAVTETTTSINGNTGGTTTSLTANDTLNAAPVVIGTNPGEVKLTGITVPTGLILNTNGTVTVAANTPAGNYNVEYSICEITNPTNCDTVISEVTVSVGTLVANADTPPSVVAGNTPQTLVNVFNNDTKNGVALVPADVNLTTTIADPTGYLTLDTNGNAILGANTPAGNYELTYTICEKLNPSNCSSNTVKVTVGSPVIDAVTETTTSINGNTGGTTTSLTTNDTLNGAAVVIGTNSGEVKLTGITVPTGLILNANGTVTVAANTPAGNYNVEYSICEITNPTNCDTVISVVVVGTATIDAVTETTTSINGNTGGTTTSLTANDTLNAAPVVIGTNPGEVKLTGITVPTGLILNTNGTVTVAANTPAGNYNVEYSICEITNPTNCDTVISEVTVSVGTLIANADTPPSVVAGNTPQTLVNVFDNDTKNGVALVPADVNLTTTIADPTGYLTLDTNGNAILGANTPAGNYELTYTICEKLNPSNCSSNTVKVTVGSPVIDAVTETTTSINGNTGGTTTSLTTNDTLNGAAVVIGTNSGEVKLTGITVPTGLILNANGTVTVAANTPAGNYNVEYSICEITNPTNCDTVISVVTVGTATIDAVTETTTSINGNTGGTTTSLTANDTLNAAPVVIGTNPGEVKLTGITVPTGLILNTNGTVTVAPNTPAGNYNVEYSICEITNPTNCDTVISVVTVSAGTLVANADTSPPVVTGNTSQTLVNVFDNDTKNGIALVPADVNLTITIADPTGYLTVDTNGNAILGANTPAGNYELTYTICEKLNPSNCSSNTVKVTVGTATIDAVTETTTSINGNTGGTTTSLTTNDTLNGAAVVIGTNSGEVKLTGITVPTGLILNANGTVTVAANTPAGNYNVEYSICEITNPTNCDTVISVVVVGTATIDAVTETTTSINGNTGGTTTSLTANDTLNAAPVVIGTNPGEVKLTGITVPTGLILNTNGTVTVAANTPAGNYNVEYSICEITNPTNCDTVISVVTVGTAAIDAITETTTSINGNTGGTTTALTTNDTLNGASVVIGTNPGEVKLTGITVPTGLTLNANGTVTVAPNTQAGNYNVEYSICEITNPTNCDTVISVVTVSAGTLVANADTSPPVVTGNTSQTLVNVFDNDTKNGIALVPADVNLTTTIADPTGYLTVDTNGNAILGANTPAGNYELTYTICEKLNPSNCSSNTVKVTVGKATIDAVRETTTSINGNTGGTTTPLTANDTLNGTPVVIGTNPGEVKLTGITVPTGLTLNANGTVSVAANTPAGNYNVEYSICEITNATNCDTVISVVVVEADVLQANDDMAGPIDTNKGVSTSLNVFDNDTRNGSAINPANVVLSTVVPNANLILNADGSVDIKTGTPSGSYQLTYQICDVSNLSNCSQAIVNVTVLNTVIPIIPTAPIVANDDIEIAVDGINGSLEFINVLDNDLLNGVKPNPADVVISKTSTSPYFEFNSDGTVNSLPNTPGGHYTVTYQICEKASASNCSTATLNIFVEFPAIAIVKTAVFNDENDSKYANAGETITYKFKITNTGNVPLKGITVRDPLPGIEVSGQSIDLDVNETDEVTFTALYKIKQSDINLGSVINQATVQGVSARGVVVDDKSDNEDNLGDKPTVVALNGCEIKVLNAFSPNGDSKNARFYIQGLECYPENTVEIYNRWGVLIFDIDHYNNEDRVFKGFSEGRTTVKQSDGLPVGTYFYILKYKDIASNSHELTGYLYLNK